jgi:hypothetical protein
MSCTSECRKPSGRMAHCGACHRTFGGITGFDRHRKGGVCNEPTSVGLRDASGIWRDAEPHPLSRRYRTP